MTGLIRDQHNGFSPVGLYDIDPFYLYNYDEIDVVSPVGSGYKIVPTFSVIVLY